MSNSPLFFLRPSDASRCRSRTRFSSLPPLLLRNNRVTSGQTICHQYWLCFFFLSLLLFDLGWKEEEEKNKQSNVQHVVVSISPLYRPTSAPGWCNPNWARSCIVQLENEDIYFLLLLPPTLLLFFFAVGTSLKRRRRHTKK